MSRGVPTPHDRRAVEAFRTFLSGETCICGAAGTLDVEPRSGAPVLVMCSACVLANVPPLDVPPSALTLPGHEAPA